MIFVVCFGPWLRALFEWCLSTNQISRILESWPLIGCWDFWFTSWRVLWSRQSAFPWSLAPRRPRRRWRRAGSRWTPWTPRGPSVTERGDVDNSTRNSKNNTQKTQELLGPPEKTQKLTLMGRNPRPTRKFAVQLTTTAIEVAVGRPAKSTVTNMARFFSLHIWWQIWPIKDFSLSIYDDKYGQIGFFPIDDKYGHLGFFVFDWPDDKYGDTGFSLSIHDDQGVPGSLYLTEQTALWQRTRGWNQVLLQRISKQCCDGYKYTCILVY